MRQYAFPYRREYSGLVGEIYRPVATVYLQSSDGRWVGFTVYADSGADITLLPRSACEGLGYDLRTGKEGHVGVITRGRIRVYVHEINMKLGEETFRAKETTSLEAQYATGSRHTTQKPIDRCRKNRKSKGFRKSLRTNVRKSMT